MSPKPPKKPFDLAAYERRVRTTGCFICRMLEGDPQAAHETVWEDADHIAFLSRYPTLLGYTLVTPKRHVEDAVGGFTTTEYLALQAVIHRVATALRTVVPCERMYVLSLGSQQGNAHVHWHVAPLPPGVPPSQQQHHALMHENGVVDVSVKDQADLAARLRIALADSTFE